MNADTLTITYRQQAAMRKAREEKLKSFRLAGLDARGYELYVVQSTKLDPDSFHTVAVGPHGKIVECSNCPGWHRAIRNSSEYTVCKHAGCVANRLILKRFGWRVLKTLLEREIPGPSTALPRRSTVQEDRSVAEPLDGPRVRKDQVYRTAS